MEFIYQGDSSFLLRGERTVAINTATTSAVDITLHTEIDRSGKQIVRGPGEYEIGDVLIVAVRPDGASSRLIHAVNVDGINVLHVDDPSVSLGEADLRSIGNVDVLIVNAGNAKAAEELAMDIAPRIVIPYGENAEQVCVLLGVREAQPQPRLSWSGTGTTPKSVLLTAQPKRQLARKRPTKAA